ncbi:uncharacterized protein V1516DRAFT_670774 [Lipomyces oligophaga]|uniref:uncharacterized protein n=1 Tax=Lipomyces oligophaga TaxID=45792 RepID=UPI0034CD1313
MAPDIAAGGPPVMGAQAVASPFPRAPSSVSTQSNHLQSGQHPPQQEQQQPHHHRRHSGSATPHRSHSSTWKVRTLGDWDLLKTVGAGSMGKVKLARHRLTGETAAVKIVPRYVREGELHRHDPRYLPITRADQSFAAHQRSSSNPAAPSSGFHIQQPAAAYKPTSDESKEIRTIREAAIISLLDHKYICSVRETMTTAYHHYIVTEYVDGGQMLDYIISHGRLKEKQARKFARQIASALDYCHHNSVVHRDLKIENILISKSGDIKIIDFGLSNLYSPHSLLKTFCGSLYFAAPELLSAKQYIGPEVDIWSFGIVLYVLACGKVPFDDQSMPALHAKIKRGHVEYPNWLSPECKNLLSRMLVVDPKSRAGLQEIINHPWMIKGYDKPQDSFLPRRRPLTLPLDPEVIKDMHGFEFGCDERIEAELTTILESTEYQEACQAWYRQHDSAHPQSHMFGNFLSASPISQSPFNLFDSTNGNNASASSPVSNGGHRKKSAFGFDFYKRKSAKSSSPSNSQETLTDSKLLDPTCAFDPLISIYYLVQEKQERVRRRPTLEASASALSLPRQIMPTFSSTSAESSTGAISSGNFAANGNVAVPPPSRLQIPVVPIPETAHTHTQPSRAIIPGRSRSVSHGGHGGYNRSGTTLPGSPTSAHSPPPMLPPMPRTSAPSESPVRSKPSFGSIFGADSDRSVSPKRVSTSGAVELPPIPSMSSSQDDLGGVVTSTSSSNNSAKPTSGISIGGIFRRLSTRRTHRSNSTHPVSGRSGNVFVPTAAPPPLSPSIASASSEDDRPPPLPTIESFDASTAFSGATLPSPGVVSSAEDKSSTSMLPPAVPGVTFSPDTNLRDGSGKSGLQPSPQFGQFGGLPSAQQPQQPPIPQLSQQPPQPPQQQQQTPQSFIRFERLFSRASNLGRSTSISEGTYNRRASRAIN